MDLASHLSKMSLRFFCNYAFELCYSDSKHALEKTKEF